MVEQEEISVSSVGSITDSATEKNAAAEDPSKVLEPNVEFETRELPEVIAAHERGLSDLLDREKPLQRSLCGVKPVDVFLWRKKKISAAVLGGATVLWVLFELLGFHLTTVVCHALIFSIGFLFLWSNAYLFINKRAPHIPDVHLPDKPFNELASVIREEINRGLAEFWGTASGGDLKKFLTVVAGLWFVSIVGSFLNFLTLVYILLVSLFTVPVLYEKRKKEIDALAEKAVTEFKKKYDVVDAKVLSKIPRLPFDKKKD